ncbi:MAG: PAS domain S-box protein [Rhizobiales bacterium]|nr:PAS domain S-box protein [Hyphomicrobiales bacterium]
MTATNTAWSQGFTGWDELGPKGQAWRIEKQEIPAKAPAPFFPDQNGQVYEQLLHNVPVLLHCMDGSGRIISVNNRWCEALGYAHQDIEGRLFNELLAPPSRTRLVTVIYPAYLQNGSVRGEEIYIHRKDGTLATVLMSMNAYRGDKGRIERSVCLLQDITEFKIAELATNRSDMRFRGAFDAAALAMALVSPTGQIELCNPAFKEFAGRPEIDARPVGFEETLHAEDRGPFINGMRTLLSGEVSALKLDLRYARGDGATAHGATSVSLVKNDRGETEQLVVQIVDISDRKEVSRRLQIAQKMEAVGQLTGGLAHDFNNLLTIISGNLELLGSKLAEDEKGAKRLREALDASRKGSDLTRQLLAVARKQNLEPQEVSVNALITGMLPLIERTLGENIQIKAVAMPGDPRSTIDASQLESAILNLSINARDAMEEGGHLTIETQPAYLDADYCEANPGVVPGNYVMIAITDNGCGMPQDVLEKVFQPFFTTKPLGKGNGLGLAMVYGFVKQSGGHINVYSEVGHGTSIKIYLPRRMAPSEVAPVAIESNSVEVPAQPAARKKRILVVEDQEAVRAVACGFLEDFGYDVVEAEDGFQALARLQEHPDIDLMFSDVVMPGGMNGFDLAQAASGMRPKLRIVHTSGYPKGAMVHQDEPRFREGFIIMKPYRREELQKIIREAFERP